MEGLRDAGYAPLSCVFTERCVIGQPCERTWRESRWMVNPNLGQAYRARQEGGFRSAVLRRDKRWKERSRALSILTPMREGVTSHLTVFDNGAAVLSIQYASGSGSGQFQRGTCDLPAGEAAQ